MLGHLVDLIAAEKLSLDLMTLHGLTKQGWSFKFDRAVNRLGACHYPTKEISLSKHMVLMSPEDEITQIILHEIAHVLVPPTRIITHHKKSSARVKSKKRVTESWSSHNAEWLAKAKSIGYTGGRTADPNSVYGRHMQKIDIQKSIAKADAARTKRMSSPAYIKKWAKLFAEAQKSCDEIVASYTAERTLTSSVPVVDAANHAAPKLARGDKVMTLGSHKRLSGRLGVIVGVGKTKYRVKFMDDSEMYAEFNMVKKVTT